MPISRLRWRPASVLTAAAAAAAVLGLAVPGLAVPAGASTGTAEISPEQAGYTATGAQFRTVFATVFLRQPAQYSGQVAGFGHSVELWSSAVVVTAGLRAGTSDGGYTTYATVYDRNTHQVIASDPDAEYCPARADDCFPGPATWHPGQIVDLRISYTPADGHLLMFEVNGDGDGFDASYDLSPQSFTQARVGTEFGSTPWDGSYPYTPPARYTKVAAYSNVALTSYSGHTASLWSWWGHHKLLANTEQQSSADWVATPTDLTNGGASFRTWFVPQNQQRRNQPVLP